MLSDLGVTMSIVPSGRAKSTKTSSRFAQSSLLLHSFTYQLCSHEVYYRRPPEVLARPQLELYHRCSVKLHSVGDTFRSMVIHRQRLSSTPNMASPKMSYGKSPKMPLQAAIDQTKLINLAYTSTQSRHRTQPK